jgi:hypothetical protein
MLIGFIFAYRNKQRAIQAHSWFAIAAIGVTYIIMHAFWKQGRLVFVYMPSILVVMIYGITELVKLMGQWKKVGFAGIAILLGFLIFVNFGAVAKESQKNLKVLRHNLQGDKYYAYTPDWKNYFLMSEWADVNTPDSVNILCRKPPMSAVYTGSDRFVGGITNYTLLSDITDSTLYKNKILITKRIFLNGSYEQDMRDYLKYLVLAENDYYYIFDFPEERYNYFNNLFKRVNAPVFNEIGTFVEFTDSIEGVKAVNLDNLRNQFVDNNIGFVEDASLRARQNKSEFTITTIRMMLMFLSEKYPTFLQKVHQIGDDDDEPAWLYSVNLEQLKVRS